MKMVANFHKFNVMKDIIRSIVGTGAGFRNQVISTIFYKNTKNHNSFRHNSIK